jgi:hypothetical protein
VHHLLLWQLADSLGVVADIAEAAVVSRPLNPSHSISIIADKTKEHAIVTSTPVSISLRTVDVMSK